MGESISYETPEEIGRIKGCNKLFEVISKYTKNIHELLKDILILKKVVKSNFSKSVFLGSKTYWNMHIGVVTNHTHILKSLVKKNS